LGDALLRLANECQVDGLSDFDGRPGVVGEVDIVCVDRIKLIQDLLLEAIEIEDADKRPALLAVSCGSDLFLREELEQLLQAEAAAGQTRPGESFLAAPRAKPSTALTS
jgi:hypothetical protein